MNKVDWLPLAEFSAKHGISVSTLRRRIRDNSIAYKIEEGKYFISDVAIERESAGRKPINITNVIGPSPSKARAVADDFDTKNIQLRDENSGSDSERISETTRFVSSANKMLEELKKAFTLILQEKEEQICQLKDEISDLRTLVRVLETENQRLRDM